MSEEMYEFMQVDGVIESEAEVGATEEISVDKVEEKEVKNEDSLGVNRTAALLKAGNVIDNENDMIFAEMPEDRQAQDIDEIRRAIGQKRILSCRVHGAEPIGDNSAKIVARRNTLRVVFIAEDFFRFTQGGNSPQAKQSKFTVQVAKRIGVANVLSKQQGVRFDFYFLPFTVIVHVHTFRQTFFVDTFG